jgi:two-component system cell cycle response regulator DivK
MKKLILIVDDHPDLVQMLEIALKFFGYEVLVAYNGLKAIEIATLKSPDLIVMDMRMPIMNGIQAISLIRQDPTTKNIPILAATANAMPGDRERCLAAGCDGYISKPFSYKKFVALINGLLRRSKKPIVSKEVRLLH